MRMNKKKYLYSVTFLLLLFAIYNLVWFFARYNYFAKYEKEFPLVADSGKKIYVDSDGYNYSVAMPRYLSWNGNLSIVEKDFQYALIIWKKPFEDTYKTGILFNGYNGITNQIELTDSKTADYPDCQKIVDENQLLIDQLYDRANTVWNLGLQ